MFLASSARDLGLGGVLQLRTIFLCRAGMFDCQITGSVPAEAAPRGSLTADRVVHSATFKASPGLLMMSIQVAAWTRQLG